MGFVRWMMKPHFPPLSLIGVGIGQFATGWFHVWWLAVLLGALSLVGEYWFAHRPRVAAPLNRRY